MSLHPAQRHFVQQDLFLLSQHPVHARTIEALDLAVSQDQVAEYEGRTFRYSSQALSRLEIADRAFKELCYEDARSIAHFCTYGYVRYDRLPQVAETLGVHSFKPAPSTPLNRLLVQYDSLRREPHLARTYETAFEDLLSQITSFRDIYLFFRTIDHHVPNFLDRLCNSIPRCSYRAAAVKLRSTIDETGLKWAATYLRKWGPRLLVELEDPEPFHIQALLQGKWEHAKLFALNYKQLTKPPENSWRASNGASPLHLAVQSGSLSVVRFFYTLAAEDMNATLPETGETPLHLAVAGGYQDIVDFLLTQGAKHDLEAKNKLHHPPTCLEVPLSPAALAASLGKEGALASLLEAGAALDTCGDRHLYLLDFAAFGGSKACLDLISHCMQEDKISYPQPSRALHIAACEGNEEAVDSLLSLNHTPVISMANRRVDTLFCAQIYGTPQMALKIRRALEKEKKQIEKELAHRKKKGKDKSHLILRLQEIKVRLDLG